MAPAMQLAEAAVQRGKDLWTWDGSLVSVGGLVRMPVRMVVAGYPLPHGKLGLVVIAPLNPTKEVVEWLQATGDVNFVVAPNKLHWFWAAAMKAAFPGSLLVAPLGLALKVKTLPVDVRVTPLAGPQDLPGSWPLKVLDLMTTQGLPSLDELVLLHKPSSTLILTDLAFNFTAEQQQQHHQQHHKQQQQQQRDDDGTGGSSQQQDKQKQQQQQKANQQQQQQQQRDVGVAGVSRLLQVYLQFAGGRRRCCLTKPFRYLIKDPGALKDSLDQVLSTWDFDQVSVSHGAFISKGGKQAFVEGTVAFVNDLLLGSTTQQGGSAGGGSALAGTGVAVLVAATVISTAVGIGVAGILQARS